MRETPGMPPYKPACAREHTSSASSYVRASAEPHTQPLESSDVRTLANRLIESKAFKDTVRAITRQTLDSVVKEQRLADSVIPALRENVGFSRWITEVVRNKVTDVMRDQA